MTNHYAATGEVEKGLIGKKRKEIEKLQKEIQDILEKTEVIKIKTSQGEIEIQTKIHHLGRTYAECEKDCPEGWEIATYPILQELRNSKHCDELNLLDTWEFVQQPDEISKNNNYVAGFWAASGWAGLFCDGGPAISFSSLGVRYFRRVK